MKRQIRRVQLGSQEYVEGYRAIAMRFAPSILPCRHCGAPRAYGYTCIHCGSVNPGDPNDRQGLENVEIVD